MPLAKTNVRLSTYGNKPLKVSGKFSFALESHKKFVVTDFFVVQGNGGCLLSGETALLLQLIKIPQECDTLSQNNKAVKSNRQTDVKCPENKVQCVNDNTTNHNSASGNSLWSRVQISCMTFAKHFLLIYGDIRLASKIHTGPFSSR